MEASMDDPVLQELQTITSLLRIGFGEQIQELRRELTSDPLSVAVLEALEAGEGSLSSQQVLEFAEAKGLKPGARTVRGRLGVMVEKGFIRRVGQGRSTEYQTTGLISL
jgi:hypothetical protein